MTISDITTDVLIEYLRIDEPTQADISLLKAVLTNSKAFISSYTGIPYTVAESETVSSSDDDDDLGPVSVKIKTDSAGYVTTVVIDDDGERTVYRDSSGAVLEEAPDNIDNYEDLWLPCMILCQDAYDNRTLYPDKSNINRAVETALSMHVTAGTLLGG